MTKSTITRERLEKINSWRETYGAGSNVMLPAEEAEELARIAMAAMNSEPVAFTEKHEISNMHATGIYLRAWPADRERNAVEGYTIPLYLHAQPAPVVPKSISVRQAISALESAGAVTTIGQAYKMGWNACRAAMLQAKSLTTINPAPTLVSLPKNAKSLTGNSPGIPDGYVMVPKEPTEAMINAWLSEVANWRGHVAGYKAMLAAAPQPQNAPQNIPEIIPGWIPVSERMPPSRHEVLVGRWWGEKPLWCCKWATYIPGHPDAQSSGWLIPGASWTPTHWMPLPAAPQEVTNGK
ncbi:Eaa1 [Klebsiella pneumoniae]|uniref:DUF551 domain-containing protein n=1 Tax=Klebsiella pneumoniae TaxID=573 RepID=UPI000E2CADBB|nr:DUF551 domain-containing protein [Klebsiella pneumoniae]SXP06051.1 Eaa1 [Klebsiella pneumoniae]